MQNKDRLTDSSRAYQHSCRYNQARVSDEALPAYAKDPSTYSSALRSSLRGTGRSSKASSSTFFIRNTTIPSNRRQLAAIRCF